MAVNLSDEKTRAYIYRVAIAALPLLVLLGLVTSALVPAIAALLAAALLPTLAAKNTSTQ